MDQKPVDLGAEYTIAAEYCAAEDDQEFDPEYFRMSHGVNSRLAPTVKCPKMLWGMTQLDAG